jgi:succinate-semialdehyde dehydrogenase / glutarate-semialdehyde dehydrogenase
MSAMTISTATRVPAEHDRLVAPHETAPRELLFAGGWRPARSGRRLAVVDPATDEPLAEVADADRRDCLDALAAAHAAAPAWAGAAPRERSRVLRRAADQLRIEEGPLAALVTAEMGKPIAESREEVRFAADYLEWFAEEAVRIDGRTCAAPEGSARHMVMRTPVGPTLIITPWNFPLAVPARGLGPALAAGCSVVLRPSALTPLSALALGRILVGAGLPAGVLNIVVCGTDDATDPLLADARLRKVTFTGSEPDGRHLIGLCAERVLRVGVELGGCAPFIVFGDADLDLAVDCAVAAKMRNGGAACTAANRFYVDRSIAGEFTRRLAERVAGIRIGPGHRRGVGLGPMISRRHVERLCGLVGDALARGARLVVRGGALPGRGNFMAPVVLADVPDDARAMREEIFGPVIAIAAFEGEAEVLGRANACAQGLAAYVHTGDVTRGLRMAKRLEAGMVALNRGRVSCVSAPFGGVKESGYGASGGAEGIDEYLVSRYVTMPEPAATAGW